ncbi:MAG: hypothetical protein V8Q75_06305 [Bacilli bacterium]
MYRCCNCRSEFEETDSKRICFEQEYGIANLFDTRTYTNIQVCPNCKDDDIEEVEEENYEQSMFNRKINSTT